MFLPDQRLRVDLDPDHRTVPHNDLTRPAQGLRFAAFDIDLHERDWPLLETVDRLIDNDAFVLAHWPAKTWIDQPRTGNAIRLMKEPDLVFGLANDIRVTESLGTVAPEALVLERVRLKG